MVLRCFPCFWLVIGVLICCFYVLCDLRWVRFVLVCVLGVVLIMVFKLIELCLMFAGFPGVWFVDLVSLGFVCLRVSLFE